MSELPTGEELWRLMFDSQQLWKKRGPDGSYPKAQDCRKVQAIAVLTKPLVYLTWGSTTRPGKPVTLPEGTEVRVVMASRFGDLGLSKNLSSTNGYFVRVYPEEGHLRVTELLEV